MKTTLNLFVGLALLLVGVSLPAAELVTSTVTLTNLPTGNTNTITINGSTRTWTNAASSSPSTQIQTTNSVVNSATNLYLHLATYTPGAGFIISQTTASNVTIKSLPGVALTVSIAGLWASVSYVTNQTTNTFSVRVPITVENATNQTNIASLLVSALNLATNSLNTNAPALGNFLTKGASPRQTISGPVTFSSLSGTNSGLTNGVISGAVLVGTVSTGLVNYGAALRSEGTGGNSFQVGSNAQAIGSLSMAIGNGAVAGSLNSMAVGNASTATNINTTAVGYGAQATTNYATAVGTGAQASADNAVAVGEGVITSGSFGIGIGDGDTQASAYSSIALGRASVASAGSSIALGASSSAGYSNSVAIGGSATVTTTNQIRMGTSTEIVSVPGSLEVIGNSIGLTLTGTNRQSGIPVMRLETITSVAAGNNTVRATNAGVRVTGTPGASWTVASLAGIGVDGQSFEIYNDSGFTITIANESGFDGTAANRIRTMTGADHTGGTNGVYTFRYDGNRSRWILRTKNP